MKKIISSKFFIFAGVLMLVLGFGLFSQKTNLLTTEVADAAATDNVSGWAWANTPQSSGAPDTGTDQGIGWISFNCTNVTGECASSNYGVKIDLNTGNFSGAAWSSNLGWISFDRDDTGNPPSDDIGGGSGAIANVDAATGVVTGWARALSGGSGSFDGWIKLSGTATDGSSYGVTVDTTTGDFSGYAWGSDVIGWVDFNPPVGDGVVLTGTLNIAPGPMNITAPETGLTGEAITYTFQAPDGSEPPDNVRYYIDWDNDGTADDVTGYVESNTAYTTTYSWETIPSDPTTYTVAAWAEDINGAVSPVATKPITISIPQCSNGVDDPDPEDNLDDINDPGCLIDPSGPSIPSNYNPQDNNETDPQCYNSNVDDDSDGVADSADPGCWTDPTDSSTYNPGDDDENNCGNTFCEASTKENFITCPVDCSAELKEF